jgi:hypothetical protein
MRVERRITFFLVRRKGGAFENQDSQIPIVLGIVLEEDHNLTSIIPLEAQTPP